MGILYLGIVQKLRATFQQFFHPLKDSSHRESHRKTFLSKASRSRMLKLKVNDLTGALYYLYWACTRDVPCGEGIHASEKVVNWKLARPSGPNSKLYVLLSPCNASACIAAEGFITSCKSVRIVAARLLVRLHLYFLERSPPLASPIAWYCRLIDALPGCKRIVIPPSVS